MAPLPLLLAVALQVERRLPGERPQQLQHLLLPRQEPLLLRLRECLRGCGEGGQENPGVPAPHPRPGEPRRLSPVVHTSCVRHFSMSWR